MLGGESLQEKTFDSRVRRSPIQNAIQIRSAEQHSAINLNAIADLWPVESVDVESLLNELQKAKQQRTTRITEQLIGPWERNKTDLFAEKTYVSLAVALANRERYSECISVCDQLLLKEGSNPEFAIIKAFALWQIGSSAEGLKLLDSIEDVVRDTLFLRFQASSLKFAIEKESQHEAEGERSRDYLSAVATWTNHHPTHGLFSILTRSLRKTAPFYDILDLNILTLWQAKELVKQNPKIKDHWLILAEASLNSGDEQQAREAIEQYAALATHNKIGRAHV